MGKPKALRLMAAMGLVLLIGLGPSAPAAAFGLQSPSSTNYRVDQVYFGNGGALNNCSTSYCAKESSGELTVGNPQSTNYQAEAGFNVDREPYVQFIVNSVSRDLGVLTPGTEATTTGTFSVKTYLAGGYVVQTVSDPPKNGARFLNALASPTAPSTTTEQFGINLVANTSPTSFGAAPVQVPGSTFSFGAAATGYNTANLYKYVKNDTIASSQSSSGETDYTISYLLGINGATPGGQYTMNDVLVATSTF
jgi:hypothetical protein